MTSSQFLCSRLAIGIAALGFAGTAGAASVTVKTDATTQAVATDPAIAALPPGSGLMFGPVIENGLGTNTPVPTGSPAGTEVVNIPPGGQYGFFRSQFTLPALFANAAIAGRANVDDGGTIYLNGTAIGTATEFGDMAFSSSLSSLFKAGVNDLIVSDLNTGGGPSGAAYWATITYDAATGSAVPEPGSWALMILGFGAVGATVRRRRGAPALA